MLSSSPLSQIVERNMTLGHSRPAAAPQPAPPPSVEECIPTRQRRHELIPPASGHAPRRRRPQRARHRQHHVESSSSGRHCRVPRPPLHWLTGRYGTIHVTVPCQFVLTFPTWRPLCHAHRQFVLIMSSSCCDYCVVVQQCHQHHAVATVSRRPSGRRTKRRGEPVGPPPSSPTRSPFSRLARFPYNGESHQHHRHHTAPS